MNKVAISAAIGVLVAGAALAAPYAGVHIPLATMMVAAAAISLGAASAVLTNTLLAKPPKKSGGGLMTERLASSGLILKFPKVSESLALSIRPETRPEFLDVVKNPAKYANKDIVVWLRGSGEEKFNPVLLKQIFTALSREGNFIHVILTARNEEFVGYIPASYARMRFTGPDAEVQIARYIVDVFADHANSVYLREIGGAGKIDVISDTAEVAEAMKRMAGGFKRLVVLHDGYHRKPIGILDFSDLMSGSLTGSAPKSIGAMRPDMRW
jgi:hypothetical protein